MPSKNAIKNYFEGANYHIFNRGVAKQDIFLDKQDFQYFLLEIKKLLKPELIGDDFVNRSEDISAELEILAFCLMSNHFHFIIHQFSIDGLTKLMRRLATSYSMYFNQKYERVGPLFQGRFKAVLIESNEQLLQESRYIHANVLDLPMYNLENFSSYIYSSYFDYVEKERYLWLNCEPILGQFGRDLESQKESYKNFVLSYKDENRTYL